MKVKYTESLLIQKNSVSFKTKKNMATIKYLAKIHLHDVEPISIIRETESSYWTEKEPSKKRAKKTDHDKLCDSELQAKGFILGIILEKKYEAQREAERLHEKYIEICHKFDM